MNIDLMRCQPGDKLMARDGRILTFLRRQNGTEAKIDYPFIVQYPEGGLGSRTRDGKTYKYGLGSVDTDIVEILKPKTVQLTFNWGKEKEA